MIHYFIRGERVNVVFLIIWLTRIWSGWPTSLFASLFVNKPLYLAIVDLEKTLDWIPRKVLWWALSSSAVEVWASRACTPMKGIECTTRGSIARSFVLDFIRDSSSVPSSSSWKKCSGIQGRLFANPNYVQAVVDRLVQSHK